jgi:hypothetical protein
MNVTYLMNIRTGAVQTAQDWTDEGFTADNADLHEVIDDGDGWWVDVDLVETVNAMRITDAGLDEIKAALKKYMREDAHAKLTARAHIAYALEIEEHWFDGQAGVGFDIDARQTVSGRPVLVQISDAGFEVYKVAC